MIGKKWNRPLDLHFRIRHRHELGSRAASEVAGDSGGLLWNLTSGNTISTFEGHTDSVNAVALSADCTRALSSSADGTLKLWHVATARVICTFRGDATLSAADFAMPHSPMVVAGDHSGRVHWRVAATGRERPRGRGRVAATGRERPRGRR